MKSRIATLLVATSSLMLVAAPAFAGTTLMG
jgi:hypothetical protein